MVLDWQDSAEMISHGAQDFVPSHPVSYQEPSNDDVNVDTARLCRTLLLSLSSSASKPDHVNHHNLLVKIKRGGNGVFASLRPHQSGQPKRSRFFFDYDDNGSGETGDTLSKKLDFLFGHEGIRFKRNNRTGSASESNPIVVRLYVPPGTSKPNILRQLSRLSTTAAFATTASGITPTFATPLIRRSLNSQQPQLTSQTSSLPTSISNNGNQASLSDASKSIQHRPFIGRVLMFPKATSTTPLWFLYSGSNGANNQPQFLSDTQFSNGAEPIRFVKKNPFDKEGIRFKRSSAETGPLYSGSFESNYVHFPFDNEGEQ